MSDRPILFSAPMVRALLAGTKTQTRRTIKPQPMINSAGLLVYERPGISAQGSPATIAMCLRIAVGDRLWVRETLAEQEAASGIHFIGYAADGKHVEHTAAGWPFKRPHVPSIHMPRWASRLTLHVTAVGVQRLQDISEEDALAEGIRQDRVGAGTFIGREGPGKLVTPWLTPIEAYGDLWTAINGAGSWDKNPWVAAYTFTVEQANIDQARQAA